jgi:hypothetical protein
MNDTEFETHPFFTVSFESIVDHILEDSPHLTAEAVTQFLIERQEHITDDLLDVVYADIDAEVQVRLDK